MARLSEAHLWKEKNVKLLGIFICSFVVTRAKKKRPALVSYNEYPGIIKIVRVVYVGVF
jgi:hypothetical protein